MTDVIWGSSRCLLCPALPAAHLLANPWRVSADESVAKRDSDFGGVNVGIIAPYAFRGTARSVDDILKGMAQLGLSSVEMQSDPVEAYAGAPQRRRGPRGSRGGRPEVGHKAVRDSLARVKNDQAVTQRRGPRDSYNKCDARGLAEHFERRRDSGSDRLCLVTW